MSLTHRVPQYRLHKPSGRAVVTIRLSDGTRRDVYLGEYNSAESRKEYARIVAELAVSPAPQVCGPAPDRTVNEVLLAFLKWAVTHYRHPDGTETTEVDEIRRSLAVVKELYGHTPAKEFGPKALAAVRNTMVGKDWCRSLVNKRVDRVKRCFKWAAAEELVPVAVFQALATLPGLRKGRTSARESAPVKPVDPATVAATLPFLSRHVRAMVELQRLTGMRPGEVCRLRLCEIDKTGEVWVYRPADHKTAHAGKGRAVPLGPKARAVLAEFLGGFPTPPGPDDAVFSPAADREERLRVWRAARKSKVQPSQVNRRKAHPKRRPGAVWKPHAYGNAIRKACAKARIGHWHPHQIRHLFATEVRQTHGLEAAQVLLGHARANVTEVYAERNLALALAVAAKIG